jgi:hypothetical protein
MNAKVVLISIVLIIFAILCCCCSAAGIFYGGLNTAYTEFRSDFSTEIIEVCKGNFSEEAYNIIFSNNFKAKFTYEESRSIVAEKFANENCSELLPDSLFGLLTNRGGFEFSNVENQNPTITVNINNISITLVVIDDVTYIDSIE